MWAQKRRHDTVSILQTRIKDVLMSLDITRERTFHYKFNNSIQQKVIKK